MELPEITKTEKIDIEDGDVLVVFVKGYHALVELERVKKTLADSFLPKKVKVVIADGEVIDMKVLRAE